MPEHETHASPRHQALEIDLEAAIGERYGEEGVPIRVLACLAHVEEGGCPFHGESSLDGIVAPTDVHAGHVGPAQIPRPLEVVA